MNRLDWVIGHYGLTNCDADTLRLVIDASAFLRSAQIWDITAFNINVCNTNGLFSRHRVRRS
jgi:hypothetical protein